MDMIPWRIPWATTKPSTGQPAARWLSRGMGFFYDFQNGGKSVHPEWDTSQGVGAAYYGDTDIVPYGPTTLPSGDRGTVARFPADAASASSGWTIDTSTRAGFGSFAEYLSKVASSQAIISHSLVARFRLFSQPTDDRAVFYAGSGSAICAIHWYLGTWYISAGSNFNAGLPFVDVPVDEWVSCAYTLDNANTRLQAWTSWDGSKVDNDWVPNGMGVNQTVPWQLGSAFAINSTLADGFDGDIDYVACFREPLQADEIQEIFDFPGTLYEPMLRLVPVEVGEAPLANPTIVLRDPGSSIVDATEQEIRDGGTFAFLDITDGLWTADASLTTAERQQIIAGCQDLSTPANRVEWAKVIAATQAEADTRVSVDAGRTQCVIVFAPAPTYDISTDAEIQFIAPTAVYGS